MVACTVYQNQSTFCFVMNRSICLLRVSELTAKNAEKDVRLLKLDGVLKSLENKVPSKESIDAIKEKAVQVGSRIARHSIFSYQKLLSSKFLKFLLLFRQLRYSKV